MLLSPGFLPPIKRIAISYQERASFPAEVWLYLLCFQKFMRSHAGFIRAHLGKSRNGRNSPVGLAFQAAKRAHGSARVQAGGRFPHAGETIPRGTREPNERK